MHRQSQPSGRARAKRPASTVGRCLAGPALGLAATLVLPPAALAGSLTAPAVVPVMVDNAKLIRLPERTQTVIVGNPFIADVTVQKNGIVVLTGKSFGTTNLIALDGGGTMIAESLIRVEAPQDLSSTVTVQRGLERESYSCTPNCQPTAQLGDSSKWFSEVAERAEKRRAGATPPGPSNASGTGGGSGNGTGGNGGGTAAR